MPRSRRPALHSYCPFDVCSSRVEVAAHRVPSGGLPSLAHCVAACDPARHGPQIAYLTCGSLRRHQLTSTRLRCLASVAPSCSTLQPLRLFHAEDFAIPTTSRAPSLLLSTVHAAYEWPLSLRSTELAPRMLGTHPLLFTLESFYLFQYFLHLFVLSLGPRLG